MKIHQLSDVQSNNIGKNTTIWQYCVILPNAIIGDNCNINAFVFIENDVKIGNNVTIKSRIQIWDDVFIGSNVTFTNDYFPRSKRYPEKFLNTIIKKGASIGANATIIGEITIGEYAMIGAGSIVTKSVGRQELWYGNPAKFRGYVCKCGNKYDENLICDMCKIERERVNNPFYCANLVRRGV